MLGGRGTGKPQLDAAMAASEDVRAAVVPQWHGRAGEVDEQLLSGQTVLAHRTLDAPHEAGSLLRDERHVSDTPPAADVPLAGSQ